jgi:hypothetical protein
MMAKKSKYRVMQFNGDDYYSYAIFHAKNVRGMSSPIMYNPQPIVCGMGYREAHAQKKMMDKKDQKST